MMNGLNCVFRQLTTKSGFTAVAMLSFIVCAGAHPAVSIIRDGRGNIFYSDLAQVWCIATNGTKTVVVSGVHTHELGLDNADNLYGEHLWYEGDATKKWGHYVWRRSPDGRIEKVIPATEGFLSNYGFVRDAAGNRYWADREATEGAAIRKKSPEGVVTTVLRSASLQNVGWMTCSPNGVLYLINHSDLICLARDGAMRVLAKRLSEDRFHLNQSHKVQGLYADDAGNVWVAVNSRRVVKKVTPDGKVAIAARSQLPWSPTGVLATTDGHLWILEIGPSNRARVWHISPDGKERQYD